MYGTKGPNLTPGSRLELPWRECLEAARKPRGELLFELAALRQQITIVAIVIQAHMRDEASGQPDSLEAVRLKTCSEYCIEYCLPGAISPPRRIGQTVTSRRSRIDTCGIPWHSVEAAMTAFRPFAPFYVWAADEIRRCEGRASLQVLTLPREEAIAVYTKLPWIVRALLPVWGSDKAVILAVAPTGFGTPVDPLDAFVYFEPPHRRAFLEGGGGWHDPAFLQMRLGPRHRRRKHGPARLPQTAWNLSELLVPTDPGVLTGDARHAAVRRASRAIVGLRNYFLLPESAGPHAAMGAMLSILPEPLSIGWSPVARVVASGPLDYEETLSRHAPTFMVIDTPDRPSLGDYLRSRGALRADLASVLRGASGAG